MKKSTLLLSITAAIILVCNSLNFYAQDFPVELKAIDEISLVYYKFTGPYMNSFDNFGALMNYLQESNAPFGPYALGIYYDDPEVVPAEKLRSEIGFMVSAPVKESEIYKMKTLPKGKALSVVYKSMDQIMPAYQALGNYIAANSLKVKPFSLEIYHSSDPNVVDAEIIMYLEN